MSGKDRTTGMKSAYELALERLSAQGIEPPSAAALSEETREKIAEARRQGEAKLAELEILSRDKLAKLVDYAAREEQEEYFRRERERIQADTEKKVAALRGAD